MIESKIRNGVALTFNENGKLMVNFSIYDAMGFYFTPALVCYSAKGYKGIAFIFTKLAISLFFIRVEKKDSRDSLQ